MKAALGGDVQSWETGMQTKAFPGGRDQQLGIRSSARRALAWGIRRPLSEECEEVDEKTGIRNR